MSNRDFNERTGFQVIPFNPDDIKIKRSYGAYGENDKILKSHDKGDTNPKNEGKWDGGFLTGRGITQEWDGGIKKLRVPIGLWAMATDDDTECKADSPGVKHGKINAFWGVGKKYHGSDFDSYQDNVDGEDTQKLSDKLATSCAVTKSKTNTLDFKGSDNQSKCFIDVTSKGTGGKCLKSGIHPGSFCQLGDNVLSSEYCSQCNDGILEKDKSHYCNWSKNRICNKGVTSYDEKTGFFDEKCVGEEGCKWGVEQEHCGTFCGTWENPNKNCLEGWGKYCQDPENFKYKNKNIDNSVRCKRVWRKFQNYNIDGSSSNLFKPEWVKRACSDKNLLTMDPSKNNIFNGTCGGLCTIKDEIDPGWCQDHVNEFCSHGNNVFTAVKGQQNSCYKFLKEYPEKTRESQKTIQKIIDKLKNIKKRDGTFDTEKIIKEMKIYSNVYLTDNGLVEPEIIPYLNKETRVGNYVGCLMGEDFYYQATRDIVKGWFNKKTSPEKIERLTNKIIAKTNILPQCFFEFCKEGGIHDDDMNIKNCPVCESTIITDIDKATMTDSEIINKVEINCSLKPDPPKPKPPAPDPPKPKPPTPDPPKPKPPTPDPPKPKPPTPDPPGSSDPPDSSDIPVPPIDQRKKIIMVGVGIIVFLLLLIIIASLIKH
jgi:hypothetical protein